jgi:hypothetical protein
MNNPDLATNGSEQPDSHQHDGGSRNAIQGKTPAHLFRFRKKPWVNVGCYLEDANNNNVTVLTGTVNAKGQRGRFDRGILKIRTRVG